MVAQSTGMPYIEGVSSFPRNFHQMVFSHSPLVNLTTSYHFIPCIYQKEKQSPLKACYEFQRKKVS